MRIPVPIFINVDTYEFKSSNLFYMHWIYFLITYNTFYIPLAIVKEHIIGFHDIKVNLIIVWPSLHITVFLVYLLGYQIHIIKISNIRGWT